MVANGETRRVVERGNWQNEQEQIVKADPGVTPKWGYHSVQRLPLLTETENHMNQTWFLAELKQIKEYRKFLLEVALGERRVEIAAKKDHLAYFKFRLGRLRNAAKLLAVNSDQPRFWKGMEFQLSRVIANFRLRTNARLEHWVEFLMVAGWDLGTVDEYLEHWGSRGMDFTVETASQSEAENRA